MLPKTLLGWNVVGQMACIGANGGETTELSRRYVENRRGAQDQVVNAAREAGLAAVRVCANCPVSGMAALAADPAARLAALRHGLSQAEQALAQGAAEQPGPLPLLAPPGAVPEATQE